MPPKKGKKGKKKPPVLIDGVDTSQMDRDELEAFLLRIKAELDKERVERNYFQIERDKLRIFWESTRMQLEESREIMHQKDREMAAALEWTDLEGRQLNQRHKYMQFETSKRMAMARAESLMHQKNVEQNHFLQTIELFQENLEIRDQMREQVQLLENRFAELKRITDSELQAAKLEYERREQDLLSMHYEHMKDQKKEQQLWCRVMCSKVEERKNRQMYNICANHDESFSELKNYYNEITLNNLALITTLKEHIELQQKQNNRAEKVAADALAENAKLKEPLEQALRELNDTRRKLEYCQQNLESTDRLKANYLKCEKRLEHLDRESIALQIRNIRLKKERDLVRRKFEDIVMEIQHKTNLKNLMYECQLEDAAQEVEFANRRNAFLKVFIEARDLSEIEVEQRLEAEIKGIIKEKDDAIKVVRDEFLRVCKAHDDLIGAYEAILMQYGIPKEELGFEPLRLAEKLPFLCGPAGLVAENK